MNEQTNGRLHDAGPAQCHEGIMQIGSVEGLLAGLPRFIDELSQHPSVSSWLSGAAALLPRRRHVHRQVEPVLVESGRELS